MTAGEDEDEDGDVAETNTSRESMSLHDSSECNSSSDGGDSDVSSENASHVAEGSYVVVKFTTKTTTSFYVGLVTEECDDESGDDFTIKFMRKSAKSNNTFVIPDNADISAIDANAIVRKLKKPR